MFSLLLKDLISDFIFKYLILTEGSIVLKFRADRGICTEYVECNLRGDTMTLNLFVMLISLF